ncbi:MAG: hypothetical protein HXY34_06640 [Candidatus Thorarchaeota archaeon]|nr:hypothetical protein [Candidatus Thorarchaeota archaeon]
MNEVVKASRAKYVVTLCQRYQSYNLVDMRVQDINVVADLNKADPNSPNPTEPVESDGTPKGKAEATRTAQVYAESKMADANSAIMVYWTGWWPLVHFVIEYGVVSGVYVSVHITADILGSIDIAGFSIQFLGIETMSAAQGDSLVDQLGLRVDSLVGTENVWSYFFAAATIAYAAAEAISTFAPPGSVHAEVAFLAFLGIFIASTVSGLVALAQAVAQGIGDPFYACLAFLGIALVALVAVGAHRKAIHNWGGASEGAARYFRFFQERYQQGHDWEKRGWDGRCHFGLMLAQLTVLVTIVIMAAGLFAGWVYQWFV